MTATSPITAVGTYEIKALACVALPYTTSNGAEIASISDTTSDAIAQPL
jgi:hypothetical protein